MSPWLDIDWGREADDYSRVIESRHETVYPWIVSELESAKIGSVLDYGGGDGALLEMITASSPCSAFYFDPNPLMRRSAVNRLRGKAKTYVRRGALDACRFDAIVFCAVWMVLASENQCIEALHWIQRHMSEGGVVIFAVTHPCFRDSANEFFRTDFPMDRYLDRGRRFRVLIKGESGGIVLHDYHWPLEAMTSQIFAAGLRIETLAELPAVQAKIGAKGDRPSWLVGTLRRR